MNNLINDFNTVYYVAPSDTNVVFDPIAIRPKIVKGRITWEDTGRGIALPIASIDISTDTQKRINGSFPTKIEITTTQNVRIALILLDLKIYNENIKNRVAGSPTFNNDPELEKFYLNANWGQ